MRRGRHLVNSKIILLLVLPKYKYLASHTLLSKNKIDQIFCVIFKFNIINHCIQSGDH